MSVVNITERRRAEEGLRRANLNSNVYMIPNIIGVIFWDTAGNIIQANGSFFDSGNTEEDILSGKARWKT